MDWRDRVGSFVVKVMLRGEDWRQARLGIFEEVDFLLHPNDYRTRRIFIRNTSEVPKGEKYPPLLYERYDEYHNFTGAKPLTPEQFIALFNQVRESVTQRIAAGEVKADPPELGRIFARGPDGESAVRDLKDFSLPLRLDAIVKSFGHSPGTRLEFIAIDTAQVEMVSSGEYQSIRMPYALDRELALFIATASELTASPRAIRKFIKRLFKNNRLKKPTLLVPQYPPVPA